MQQQLYNSLLPIKDDLQSGHTIVEIVHLENTVQLYWTDLLIKLVMNFEKLAFLIQRTAFRNLDYHLLPTRFPYPRLCFLLWNYISSYTRCRNRSCSIHGWMNLIGKRELTKCLQFLQFSIFEQTVRNRLCKIIIVFWFWRIRSSLNWQNINGNTFYLATLLLLLLLLSIRGHVFLFRIVNLTMLLIN